MTDRRRPYYQTWSLNPQLDLRPHQTTTARFHSLTPTSPTPIKVFLQAHTPADFTDAPVVAVKTLLSFPTLSIPEDDILLSVLRYVCGPAHIPHCPIAWTSKERAQVFPVLHELLPNIRILSLSTRVFLRYYEPLDVLDGHRLLGKFRYDALCRAAKVKSNGDDLETGHLSFRSICRYYRGMQTRREIFASLRGLSVIVESPHPCRGGTELVTEVRTAEWAPRMLLEFDRRTQTASDVSLHLCSRKHPSLDKNQQWSKMWPHQSHGVKFMVWDSPLLYIELKSQLNAKPVWGWKLLATPLIQDEDLDYIFNEAYFMTPAMFTTS